MKYLLDTDIASYYLRGRYNLIDIFKRKDFSEIAISIVTVAELEVLANKNPKSAINFESIKDFAAGLKFISPDRATWQIFSRKKAKCLQNGKPRGDFDILLASLAEQYNLVDCYK
jgi:tRNA(fMet)-specific endonuclease VapC